MKLDLERYLRELENIVNIDSGQGNPEGITAVGNFFADRFAMMGWIVEKYDLRPHTGNCTVVKNREAYHYDVMLVGHVDTVFEAGQPQNALVRSQYCLGLCPKMKYPPLYGGIFIIV